MQRIINCCHTLAEQHDRRPRMLTKRVSAQHPLTRVAHTLTGQFQQPTRQLRESSQQLHVHTRHLENMLPNSVSPEMLAAAGLNADLLAKLSAPATTTAANTGIAAPIPVVATMPNPSPQLSGFMDWLQQYANPGLPSAPLAAIPPPPISTYSLHPSGSMEATHTRSDSKDTEPEGMKELVHKVQRRLHQNRESARKCRQRKKAYLQELEEELHLLRRQHEEAKQHKITNVATGLSANTSREGAEAIAALLKWQQDWEAALGRVRRLINAAGTDDQLQYVGRVKQTAYMPVV